MSESALEKMTKTQIGFPTSVESLIDQIRALQVLTELFFGARSYPAQGLRYLSNNFLDNKTLLKVKLSLDEEFIAKVLCSVDDCLYQWLRECYNATTFFDTTINLTHFSQIFSDIQFNRFEYNLPLKVKNIKREVSTNDDNPRKHKRQSESKSEQNQNIEREWKLKGNEKWDTAFRNKTRKCPALSAGCQNCLKFHVKG